MKNYYQKFKLALLSAFAFLMYINVYAQEQAVKGKVTDNTDGSSLPGVNVIVKGTTIGSVTDVDGNYTISVPDEADILVFSSVGYAAKEVAIGNQSVINVKMAPDIKSLSEVVVVGYGTQERKDITGSISSVSGEELTKMPVPSFNEALQGRAPGVFVTNDDGAPGGGVSVRVRGWGVIGDSEPLYVIDGIPVKGNDQPDLRTPAPPSNILSTINPNDIESIEVLKDASAAALYGSRAANGVVLITTKRGKAGKAQINYSGYYGAQRVINEKDLLNAREYATIVNETLTNDGKEPYFDLSTLDQNYADTDWLNEVFRTAPIQDHQLSVAGGSDKTQYFISGNYMSQAGTMIGSDFQRVAFRINTDNQLASKLKVGNTLQLSYKDENVIPNGDPFNGTLMNVYRMPPTVPVRNPDGTYGGANEVIYENARNPVALALDQEANAKVYKAIGSIYGEYEILQGLKYRMNLGINLTAGDTRGFRPIYNEGRMSSNLAEIDKFFNVRNELLFENQLTYNKTFGEKHAFTALAAISAQKFTNSALGGRGNAETNKLKVPGAITQGYEIRGGFGDERLVGYLGRITYAYDDRYLFTGNVRVDGSSKFGPNNKWGTFPSVSAGWRISEESFMSDVEFISDMKLRASYGQVGSNSIPDFGYLALIMSGQDFAYPFGGEQGPPAPGAGPTELPNPDIKWETSTQAAIGLDMGLFNNQVLINVDYFEKSRTDMLLRNPLVNISGTSQDPWGNYGEVINNGIELALQYRKYTGDFTYDFSGNLTTYNNQVTDLGVHGNEPIIGFEWRQNTLTLLQVGQPVGVFYGYEMEGIFQNQAEVDAANALNEGRPYQAERTAPGDVKFKDIDGNGYVDENDRTYIGSPIPDFTYGFNANLGYKGFELSLFLQGVQGADIYNFTPLRALSTAGTGNRFKEILNRWTPDNPSTTVPRLIASNPNDNDRVSSRFVEDGSYLRLKNVQLAYNLPNRLLESLGGLSNLRIYVTGTNLLTFTNYSGIDPEIGMTTKVGGGDISSNSRANFDFYEYPKNKRVIVGLNIGF